MKKIKLTLTQRVKDLERVVYRQYVEDCPRCHQRGMNAWQPDVCSLCAYMKGDSL